MSLGLVEILVLKLSTKHIQKMAGERKKSKLNFIILDRFRREIQALLSVQKCSSFRWLHHPLVG